MLSLICNWTNVSANNQDAGDLRRHRAHYDITVMRISSVIKISFCRILFSGHQNKFCACLDSIYGRVSCHMLVMCKNCSDISWHRLKLNQSKTNCPKNLNSDGLIVREMGPWPKRIFRSLLEFFVRVFHKVTRFLWPRKHVSHAVRTNFTKTSLLFCKWARLLESVYLPGMTTRFGESELAFES